MPSDMPPPVPSELGPEFRLVSCPDCGHQVARSAASCPNCGSDEPGFVAKQEPCRKCQGPMRAIRREPRPKLDPGWVIAMVVGVGLLMWGVSMPLIVGAPVILLASVEMTIANVVLAIRQDSRRDLLIACSKCKGPRQVPSPH